jgi:hypothetical protein
MNTKYTNDFQRALALVELLDMIAAEPRDYGLYRDEMQQIFSDCAFDFVSSVLRNSPTHELDEILLRLPATMQVKALPVLANRLRYFEVFEREVSKKNLLATLAVVRSQQPAISANIDMVFAPYRASVSRAA